MLRGVCRSQPESEGYRNGLEENNLWSLELKTYPAERKKHGLRSAELKNTA